MSRIDTEWHIYDSPRKEGLYYIFTKNLLGETCAIYKFATKKEALKRFTQIVLLNKQVPVDFTYEFLYKEEFYYLTNIELYDKNRGLYSFSMYRMSDNEMVKSFDGFESKTQAINKQKELCKIPIEKPKKATIRRVKPEVTENNTSLMVFRNDSYALDKNLYDMNNILLFIREKIIEGIPKWEIRDELNLTIPVPLSKVQYESAHNLTLDQIRNVRISPEDYERIKIIHNNWYERIYRFFHTIHSIPGMNKTLEQKEKLFGIHKDETYIEINQQNNFNTSKVQEKYNLEALEGGELKRFHELMRKVRDNGDPS